MADEKPPAFQFYVKEWRSSRAVQRMTFGQRGMYLEMLLEQWDKESLPDDPAAVCDLLGGSLEEWRGAWPVLRRKFVDRRHRPRKGDDAVHVPTDHDASRRIINLRLERCRSEWLSYKKGKREAGSKGGRANAKKLKEIAEKHSLSSAEAVLEQKEAPLKPSLLFSSPATAPSPAPPPAGTVALTDARSKRPIFRGQRLTVFEWMLEDLSKLLGSHTETFDLHEWFFTLDARAVEADVVVPQKDGGRWLHDRTLEEAIRRGLPVAASRSHNPKTAGNAAALAAFVAGGQR